MQKKIHTASAEETEALGERIGRHLRGGEVIELQSDLGGGKTTFVRGLARGAGSEDHVASPTFTIKREYAACDITLHHFDFYRLNDAGIMADELAEITGDAHMVAIIEWSDVVKSVLPENRLRVSLELAGDTARTVTLHYPDKLHYLAEEA